MSETWWFNGKQTESLPTGNRGLAYGDGLFETMRLMDGTIPLFRYHLSRLQKGANRLGLIVDMVALQSAIDQAVSMSTEGQYVLKLICVRTGFARGYMPDENRADILLRRSPLIIGSSSIELSAKLSPVRLASQPALAGIKHLNRLEQVLAARDLGPEMDEAIMLDVSDNLIEAISSNLILVSANSWLFPDLSQSGVDGVMQAYIRDQAKNLDVGTETRQVAVTELPDFDEILLVNAVRGVRNLGKIGREWVASSQTAGARLREYLLNELHAGFQSF